MTDLQTSARQVRCIYCGAINPAERAWCQKCERSLHNAKAVWSDPTTLDERQLLVTLVQDQRQLLEEQEAQTSLLQTIKTAAVVWLVLTAIGLVLGVLVWLL